MSDRVPFNKRALLAEHAEVSLGAMATVQYITKRVSKEVSEKISNDELSMWEVYRQLQKEKGVG